MKKKIFLSIIILLIVIYNITLVYVDKNIKDREQFSYNNHNKIWSARGLYDSKYEQNSITSMKKAFKHGAIGAEVDLYYDIGMDNFIISHDKPKEDVNGKLIYEKKDGEVLTLKKFLKALHKEHYFWLDFKNLDRISEAQTKKAVQRLNNITQYDSIKQRIYIEGSNPLLLSKYPLAGYKTILGVHPLKNNNFLSSLTINSYKILYYFSNATALAMPYGSLEKPIYETNAKNLLKNIPVFIFHVPDNDYLLQQLVNTKDVKVLLVSRDKSVNKFHIKQLQ